MGNTDSIPVVSQVKSLVQVIGGDPTGALATQENFAYRNTFPVVSQIASAGYAIGGDMDKAKDLQEKFAADMERVIDSIPVAGHIKGGIHYALGEKEKGEDSLKAASRSTGVVLGGLGGLVVGGPVGAVAGGIAGGAAADGVITGSDILDKGKENAKPYGYVAVTKDIVDAVKGGEKITVEQGFDMALMPVGDGIGGYTGAKVMSKPLGLKPAGSAVKGSTSNVMTKVPIPGIKSGYKGGGAAVVAQNAVDDLVKQVPETPRQISILEQRILDNRANQLNPNHVPSGPGRPAGYRGLGTKPDLDNHANQLNPNNKAYVDTRTGSKPAIDPDTVA